MTNPYNSVKIPQFILANELLMVTYRFAAHAHEYLCTVTDDGSMHLRKYSDQAYIIHPIAVAEILWEHGITNVKMLQAALLHDTIEDTSITAEDIKEEFGKRVAAMVVGLTDVSVLGMGSRDERKALDRDHTSKQDPDTLTIKTADLIHNTIDITARDPDFAVAYTHEKALLLRAILKGGHSIKSDRSLYERAVQQLLDYHYERAVDKYKASIKESPWTEPGSHHIAKAWFVKGVQQSSRRYKVVLDLAERIELSG